MVARMGSGEFSFTTGGIFGITRGMQRLLTQAFCAACRFA
jgi:hypothetical protein